MLLLLVAAVACGDGPVLTLGDADPPRFRFGPPELVVELSVSAKTDNPSLTEDMLEIYFTSERNGGPADIFVAERTDRALPFGPAQWVEELSGPGVETSPAVSADGLAIWFASDRIGGQGGLDIWLSMRASRADPWSAPENLDVLSSAGNDIPRPPGQRARVMPMASDVDTPPFYQIQLAERGDAQVSFDAPVAVPELSFPEESTVDAFLTDDGLTLFYVSGPAFGPADLFVATRRSTADAFERPTLIEELSSPADERDPWLSPDGRELFFSSDRSGEYDIYVATVEREPPTF
ncbi:MAG: hypothetical protein OXT09_14675 [Myxococcales bacterium]|nr:hypothetical protein [Myxococcales bacterium]